VQKKSTTLDSLTTNMSVMLHMVYCYEKLGLLSLYGNNELRHWLKDQGSILDMGSSFSLCHCVQTSSAPIQPPSQWILGLIIHR
jgi:hypothetical protein